MQAESSTEPPAAEPPVTHHMSDVDTWGNPDRNYIVFVALSIVFGFLGLDHFYLRSFGTGTQKLVVNFLTLGFWYWWDLIQVLTDGAKIRKEGLSSPMDWIRGIGRGVFKPLSSASASANKCGGGSNTQEKEYAAEKSYLIYAILAICFGWLGADKFYLGRGWEGAAKIFSCFNIFLFLFGWVWVLWDAFHAFFMTKDVLKNGISAPMPYSMFFTEPVPGTVFKVEEVKEGGNAQSSVGLMDWIAKTFNFPSVPSLFSPRELYRELIAPLAVPPLVRAVQEITHPTPPSDNAPAGDAAGNAAGNAAPEGNAPANALPSSENAAAAPAQRGGARAESSGPGPIIAGALTAVVMAGGLKGFYDMLIRQRG
jgi:TM2 domain-containing membrane protein YozV